MVATLGGVDAAALVGKARWACDEERLELSLLPRLWPCTVRILTISRRGHESPHFAHIADTILRISGS